MTDKVKIMIVDDNPDDRSLAIRELRRNFRDIEIIEIIDADELDEAMDEGEFDIVITDYHIRWTDGLKVLRRVKERKPDCPVIMFTGTGNEEVAVQAMKSGLEDYVVKSPKHFVRLSASVHSALQDIKERRAKKELEDLYTRLFERVPLALYSVDTHGRILAANTAMLDLLGIDSKDELNEYRAQDFHIKDEKRDEEISILDERGLLKGYELHLKRVDGEDIWVKDYAYVIRDEKGEIKYIEGSLEDITAIKKAHLELKEQRDKIERLHEVALKILDCTEKQEVYETTIEAAKNILGFSACTIHEVEDDEFVVRATQDGALEIGSRNPIEGVAGKSYREQRSILLKDISEVDDAKPADKEYRSGISIPIGEKGVFLNISTEADEFDEDDLKMGEILVSHMTDALRRIDFTDRMKENEEKLEQLHRAASKMETIMYEDELYDISLELASDVLDFQWCTIHIIEDGDLIVKATTHLGTEVGTHLSLDEGIYGKTCMEKRTFIVDDVTQHEDAKPSSPELRSVISVPLGEFGDLQVLSDEAGHFNETDKKFAELLANHITEALQRIKKNKQLKKSEERYRLITENSYDLIAMVGYDGKLTYANKAFQRVLGYDNEELIGEYIFDMLHPEDKEGVEDIFYQTLEKGIPHGVAQFKLKDDDGNYRWFEAVGRGVEGEDLVMVVSRDIDKRKKAEIKAMEGKKVIEKLHETASKMMNSSNEDDIYKLTIEAASNILDFDVCTIAIEEDDHLLIKETTGEVYREGIILDKGVGIIGKTYNQKKAFIIDRVDELDEARPYNEEYRSALSVPFGDIGVFQSISYTESDFDEHDLERAEILITHAYDVIKRIRYEKELGENQKRYKSIFENTGTAMVILDPEMEIKMCNLEAQNLLGYDPEEMTDKNLADFVLDKKELEDLFEILFDAEYNGQHRGFLSICNRYDDVKDIFLVSSVLPDYDRILVSMLDVTQQVDNMKNLEQSQELFRVAFEGAPISMLLVDEGGIILEANEAMLELVGIPEDELLSMNLEDLISSGESIKEMLLDEGKEKISKKISLKNKDDEEIICSLTAMTVKQEGQVDCMLIYLKES